MRALVAAAEPPPAPTRWALTQPALPYGSDGTEKVAVAEGASLRDLRCLLETQLAVPYADQTLSRDQGLVRAFRARSCGADSPLWPPLCTP